VTCSARSLAVSLGIGRAMIGNSAYPSQSPQLMIVGREPANVSRCAAIFDYAQCANERERA